MTKIKRNNCIYKEVKPVSSSINELSVHSFFRQKKKKSVEILVYPPYTEFSKQQSLLSFFFCLVYLH